MLRMFFNVIEINIVISILMILLLIFCKKIRKRYGALWMKIIWIILAVRLAIPFNISTQNGGIHLFTLPSEQSVVASGAENNAEDNAGIDENIVHVDEMVNHQGNDVDDAEATLSGAVSETVSEAVSDAANGGSSSDASGVDQNIANETVSDMDKTESMPVNESVVVGDDVEKSTDVSNDSTSRNSNIFASKELIFARVLPIIWLAGVGVALLILHIRYLLFAGSIKKTFIPLRDEKFLNTLGKLSKSQSDKSLVVYQSSAVDSPMLIGLFRTVLVVPERSVDWDEEVTEMILAHEMAHFDNRDLYVKAFMNIICCMNWFNPFVYILRKQMFYDIELRCDQIALGSRGDADREKYAKVLLSLVREKKRFSAFQADFGNSKEVVKDRMSFIFNSKRAKNGIVCAIALAVLMFAGCFMISCGNRDDLSEGDAVDSAQNSEELPQSTDAVADTDITVENDDVNDGVNEVPLHTGECEFEEYLGQLGESGEYYDEARFNELGEYELEIDCFYADVTHDGIDDLIKTVVFNLDKNASIDTAINGMSAGSFVKVYKGIYEGEYEESACFVSRDFHMSHLGNGSAFLVDYEGQDYLMIASLYEGQGQADYNYTLFYIDDSEGIITQDRYGVTFATDNVTYQNADGREVVEPLFDSHIEKYIDNSEILLALDCEYESALYSTSENRVMGIEYLGERLKYLYAENVATVERKENKCGEVTVYTAPERPMPAEGIEVLDVTECLSDFSLLITIANNTEDEFSYVLDYALDVLIDGEWYEYKKYRYNYVEQKLPAGKTIMLHYELCMYSDLPVGQYRITSREGISGQFVINEPGIYELYAVGDYPERSADEIYQSIVENGKAYYIDYSYSYVYEKYGFHDVFYMVFYEDHRFSYMEGVASSYMGGGRWEIDGDELIMTDDYLQGMGSIVYYFRIEDNILIYEEEKSSGYIYARVADGERFICDCDLWKDAVNGNSDQKVLYDSYF